MYDVGCRMYDLEEWLAAGWREKCGFFLRCEGRGVLIFGWSGIMWER